MNRYGGGQVNQNPKPALVANVEKKTAKYLLWVILGVIILGFLTCVGKANAQEVDVDQLALTTNLMAGTVVMPVAVLQEDEPIVTFSGGIEAWSRYFGSSGAIYHDKPVLQGNVTFSFRGGCYVDIWGSRTNGSWRATWGDEVDFTVGCGNDFVDAGISYLMVSYESPSDVGWAYVNFTTPTYTEGRWSIAGFLKIDYYKPFETVEDYEEDYEGYNFHLGGRLSQEGDKWSTSQELEVLYDTGAWGAGEGLVWIASAEVARKAGTSTVGVGIKYSRGINLPEWDDRTGEVAFGTFIRF